MRLCHTSEHKSALPVSAPVIRLEETEPDLPKPATGILFCSCCFFLTYSSIKT
jgi:hypothetical protein